MVMCHYGLLGGNTMSYIIKARFKQGTTTLYLVDVKGVGLTFHMSEARRFQQRGTAEMVLNMLRFEPQVIHYDFEIQEVTA